MPVTWNYLLEYEDDQEWLDVEAETVDAAARLIYEKWKPTAWQLATVGHWCINLDAPNFITALRRI